MSKLRVLTRVSGEKLSLIFNIDESVSSAKFCAAGDSSVYVTSELRFVRESTHEKDLRFLGFEKEWSPHELSIFQNLNLNLQRCEFKVGSLLKEDDGTYKALFVNSDEKKAPTPELFTKALAVARFDARQLKFTEMLKSNITENFHISLVRLNRILS